MLDGNGVTSSTAGLFVGYTVVEFKESLLLSTVSRVVRATWAGLEVSLLDEPGLWPGNGGSREGGGLSQMETGCRGPNP